MSERNTVRGLYDDPSDRIASRTVFAVPTTRARWKAARATARARWRAWRVASRNRAAASTCFYCGVPFDVAGKDHRTVDHRVPKSRGGSDGLRNLVFACYACNQRKRDRPEDQFLTSEWLSQRRADVASRMPEAEPPST